MNNEYVYDEHTVDNCSSFKRDIESLRQVTIEQTVAEHDTMHNPLLVRNSALKQCITSCSSTQTSSMDIVDEPIQLLHNYMQSSNASNVVVEKELISESIQAASHVQSQVHSNNTAEEKILPVYESNLITMHSTSPSNVHASQVPQQGNIGEIETVGSVSSVQLQGSTKVTRKQEDLYGDFKYKSNEVVSSLDAEWIPHMNTSNKSSENSVSSRPQAYFPVELHQDYQHRVQMVIPSSAAAGLIGKGGEIIQHISQLTNCKLSLKNLKRHDEGVLYLFGKSGNICQAQRLVINRIVEYGEEIKHPLYTTFDSDQIVLPWQDMKKKIDSGNNSATIQNADIKFGEVHKKSRSCHPTRCIQHVSISVHAAGVLIGPGGEIIREISVRSGAQIHVIQPEDLPLGSRNRLVQIRGTEKQISHAFRIIRGKFRDSAKPIAEKRDEAIENKLTLKILLPSYIVATLLNYRGRLSKEISQLSGAFIRYSEPLDPNSMNDERRELLRKCILSGTLDAVLNAEHLILQIVASATITSKCRPVQHKAQSVKRKRRDDFDMGSQERGRLEHNIKSRNQPTKNFRQSKVVRQISIPNMPRDTWKTVLGSEYKR